jgi:antitoxin ParD1/3/4
MQSMNISLPEPLKQFVETQIASGRYSSASEYVRELIRDDERRRAQERLEAFLLQGLDSPAIEWTQEDVNHIKNAVRERLAAKQTSA